MTSIYPLVQFVDAPDPSATVRFDFNARGTWADDEVRPNHDGFSIGVPQLIGEPDSVAVEYDLRTLSFSLMVAGSRLVALRAQRDLAREILRPSNWLMF